MPRMKQNTRGDTKAFGMRFLQQSPDISLQTGAPIHVEWVKGLKSIHLQNNTANRVESFFSKLKVYFSPRSELKETTSGLMNCIDSLRSERHFHQIKQITRIKVEDLSLSHLESQYQ